MSGGFVAPPGMDPGAGYPPPQAGYPPPQAGYPPPQAGYPPPQVGYTHSLYMNLFLRSSMLKFKQISKSESV